MRSVARAVLVAAVFVFFALPSFARTKPIKGPVERIRAALSSGDVVRIIVGVDVPGYEPEGNLKGQAIAAQHRNIHATQQKVLNTHRKAHVVPGHQYVTLPLMAVDVDAAAFEDLIADDDVTAVEENSIMRPALRDTTFKIGMPSVWLQVTNYSYAVAVFDTGVAKGHDFFKKTGGGNRVTFEACFSSHQDGTNLYPERISTCANGGPSQFNDPPAVIDSGEPCNLAVTQDCGHGSLVAGIAAGYTTTPQDNGTPLSGVAPGASIMSFKLVSLRGGNTEFQLVDLINAIDYINTNYATYFTKLAAINMSFVSLFNAGTPDYYVTRLACSGAHPLFVQSVAAMQARDIAIVAATGNENRTNDLSFPACMPGVIAVGATTKNDAIWYEPNALNPTGSNSTAEIDLLAPGAGSTVDDGIYAGVISTAGDQTIPGLQSYSDHFAGSCCNKGTSLAAPHVAGAIAVLKALSPTKTVDAIRNGLINTGTPIFDPRNNVTKPRINVNLAADTSNPTTPANVTATGSDSHVYVSWSASTDDHGIDHYTVFKRSSVTGQFASVGDTTSTDFLDTTVSAGWMFEYYVVAYDAAWNSSSQSTHRYATTVSYTNDPIGNSTLIYGRHIRELRQAIDAWRRFANLSRLWVANYTDLTGLIYANDVSSLVTALNPARWALGLTTFAYSGVSAPAIGGFIDRKHVQQLRDALK